MDYISNAYRCFDALAEDTPANGCSLLVHERGVLADAGCECPGGWAAAKTVLEALTGSRGQINFAQIVVDGAQYPAVELFLDDPEGAAGTFTPDENGLFGIRDGESFAFGVSCEGTALAMRAEGNFAACTEQSLLAGVLHAASLIPAAVEALRRAGVKDIQWAWSSCPVAPYLQDAAQGRALREKLTAGHGTVNVWARGEEAAIRAAVDGFTMARLHVHELASACTYLR